MGFDFKILGFEELRRKMEALPGQFKIAMEKSVQKGTAEVWRAIVHKASDDRLKRRTGRLVSSIRILAPIVTSTEVKGIIKVGGESKAEPVKYARIQEEGGTIRPKNGKYLTIPTEFILTNAGVARFTAREVISNPQEFGFKSTFFGGNILYGDKGRSKEGQTNRLTPLFTLVASVNIKPKWYVRDSVKETRPKMLKDFRESLKERLKAIGIK